LFSKITYPQAQKSRSMLADVTKTVQALKAMANLCPPRIGLLKSRCCDLRHAN